MHTKVGAGRLELPTSRSQSERSSHLNYAPIPIYFTIKYNTYMLRFKLKKKYVSLLLTLLLILLASFYQSSFKPSRPELTPTPSLAGQADLVRVTKVIDGDTIEIESGKRVRYIGINTPEIHSPTRGVECFGKEAAAKNKELVEGKLVRLEKDVSETDKYGRLLRFVFLPLPNSTNEAIFVNDYLVKEGYAQASTFPPDVRFAQMFQESEGAARDAGAGLWTECQ